MVREARMHRPSRSGPSAAADPDGGGIDALDCWDDSQNREWDELFDCDWLDEFGNDDG
jgi:hypothetical protein